MLSELRKRKGITQEFLAENLGITADTLRKIEKGETSFKLNLLPRLVEIFGEDEVVKLVAMELRRNFDEQENKRAI